MFILVMSVVLIIPGSRRFLELGVFLNLWCTSDQSSETIGDHNLKGFIILGMWTELLNFKFLCLK